jgi:hypothetical protein
VVAPMVFSIRITVSNLRYKEQMVASKEQVYPVVPWCSALDVCIYTVLIQRLTQASKEQVPAAVSHGTDQHPSGDLLYDIQCPRCTLG